MQSNASFAPSASFSTAGASSGQLGKPPVMTAGHWSTLDSVEISTQTEDVDCMRRMQKVFLSVVLSVRDEVCKGEELARDKLVEWDRTFRFNLWVWDAAVDMIRDGEHMERTALVESEMLWRDEYFHTIEALCLQDVRVEAAAAAAAEEEEEEEAAAKV